jgi:hypothetical protein
VTGVAPNARLPRLIIESLTHNYEEGPMDGGLESVQLEKTFGTQGGNVEQKEHAGCL